MIETLAWTAAVGLAVAYGLLVASTAARAWRSVEEERRLLRYRPPVSMYVALALMCAAAPLLGAWTRGGECAQRARKWIAYR